MEVGSVREKIIVALLLYKFGEINVETKIPITESEVDARLFGNPISVKTTSGKGLSGVKLIWTVDADKAKEFSYSYNPSCDILLIQIVWDSKGGLYYIPVETQRKLLLELGREKYIKLPKQGTNPRGVEITSEALSKLIHEKDSRMIEIDWRKSKIDYHPYKRWIDYWSESE